MSQRLYNMQMNSNQITQLIEFTKLHRSLITLSLATKQSIQCTKYLMTHS